MDTVFPSIAHRLDVTRDREVRISVSTMTMITRMTSRILVTTMTGILIPRIVTHWIPRGGKRAETIRTLLPGSRKHADAGHPEKMWQGQSPGCSC
ncbi:MAG: hypothetical protein GXP49_16405 [Deltaproteobacteria bacterium]|nr:hypothetical protein [Deltaproteobacteria bacterium]